MVIKAKSARAKGNKLQAHVAERIRAKGLDLKARSNPDSGSGTQDKSDVITCMQILGQNAGIECKNHTAESRKEWWKQTKKLESLSLEPVLVYKLGGEEYKDTKAVIYLETLLDLIQEASGTTTERVITIGDSQNLRYKGENLVRAIKDYSKALKAEEEIDL